MPWRRTGKPKSQLPVPALPGSWPRWNCYQPAGGCYSLTGRAKNCDCLLAIGTRFGEIATGSFGARVPENLIHIDINPGIVYFVFNGGELSQIAQAQEIPYNRKPCAQLAPLDFAGIARGVGAQYVALDRNDEADTTIARAFELAARNTPVIVDVTIDYSKRTAFTLGTVKTNFQRLNLGTKLRFVSRALSRRVRG
jgi:acetolactate synthase I/II/III large subunit